MPEQCRKPSITYRSEAIDAVPEKNMNPGRGTPLPACLGGPAAPVGLRGKRSEIDHLNGQVARKGAAHGIPTPTNRLLHTLVKLLEDGQPRPPAA